MREKERSHLFSGVRAERVAWCCSAGWILLGVGHVGSVHRPEPCWHNLRQGHIIWPTVKQDLEIRQQVSSN